MTGRRDQLAICLLLAVVAAASSAAPALAETPSIEGAAAFALVNEQRAANGIPEFTTENQSLASWCPNEDYGAGGSGNRVLSEFTWAWSATESPWETAPFHEALMYDPIFTEAGDVDATGPYDGTGPVVLAACMSVEHERPRPSAPQGYVFYAPGGPSDMPPAYTAFEAPRTPAEDLGLPETTGPNIIAYAVATNLTNRIPSPEGAVAKVSLATEGGEAVNGIKVVESLSESFIVVPPQLLPETHYHGNVTIELNPHAISGEPEVVNDPLNFTTLALPNHATINSVTATPSTTGGGGTVNVYVSLNADPHATVAVSAPSFAATQALSAIPGQNVSFTVPVNGPGEACLSSPAHDGYAPLNHCASFDLVPKASAGPGGGGGSAARISSAQVLNSLVIGLRASTKATIRRLLKHGIFSVPFKALEAGRLIVQWYELPRRARRATAKPILVASGRTVFTAAGTANVKISLTSQGKKLLEHISRLKLTAKATFTPTGKTSVSTTRTFVLK